MLVVTDNDKYVKRGSDLIVRYDPIWEDELKEANQGKVGARFMYSDSLIMMAAALRMTWGIQLRQLEGLLGKMLEGHASPDYTVLCRRINKLDVDIDNGIVTVYDPKKLLTLVVDSTGIKQFNRGEWIRQKWKVRRGFVKIHILADIETKKIIAVMVTDDKTGDSPVLKDLLGTVVEPQTEKPTTTDAHMYMIRGKANPVKGPILAVESSPVNMLAEGVSPLALLCETPHTEGACLLADGAYASRNNMKLCKTLGIKTLIPLRTDSTTKGKGTGDAWGDSVRRQLGASPETRVDRLTVQEKIENKTYWKRTVGYGKRWTIEIIISAFKRMFGEDLHARTWKNMVQEIKLRIAQYNKWQEAAAM